MPLTVTLEAMAGDSIEHTAEEMTVTAARLGLHVKVRFNGVTIISSPIGLPNEIVQKFCAVVGDETVKHKLVIV